MLSMCKSEGTAVIEEEAVHLFTKKNARKLLDFMLVWEIHVERKINYRDKLTQKVRDFSKNVNIKKKSSSHFKLI